MDPQKNPTDQPPNVGATPETVAPGGDSPAAPVMSSLPDEKTPFSGPETPESPVPTVGMSDNPLPVSVPKARKKGLILGLVVAAAVLLLSGGASAAFYYVTVNKPENVLRQAMANSLDTDKSKTVHFSGALNVEEQESDMAFEATYKGAADTTNFAFNLSGSMDVTVSKITFDFRSPDSKTFYAKVGGLDGLPELLAASGQSATAYAPLVQALNDQWIEINDSFIKQFDKSYESLTLSDADRQKIGDLYMQHEFITVKEALADETIGGASCHHYKLAINPTELKNFVKALKDANLSGIKINQETLDGMNKAIDDADLQKVTTEVWISAGDKMFKQIVSQMSEDGASAKFRLTYDSYNQPVKVDKPAGSKSIMELLGDFFGGGTSLPLSGLESGISL